MRKNTAKRPFSLIDLHQINGISSPQLSPAGDRIAYVISLPDPDKNSWDEFIALKGADDAPQLLLARGSTFCWAPDARKIAYESGEGGLYIYDFEKNTSQLLAKVCHSSHFINHLEDKQIRWSPDGKFIAFLSATPRPGHGNGETEVRVINRLSYKTKGGRNRPSYNDNFLTHIYLVPASGGTPELLTKGDYDEHSLSWSPDSAHLAFISNRSEDPDNNQYSDLWRVNVRTKEVTRLTDDLGTAFQPAWSPNGRSIAYLATRSSISTNDSTADDTHVYVLPAGGGTPRCLTESLDRRVENITWDPEGEYIYFTAEHEGRVPVFCVSMETGKIETVIEGDFRILAFSLDHKGEEIAYVRTGTAQPAEIFLTRNKRRNTLRIIRQNLSGHCMLQEARSFWYQSFDATGLQGWLMPPVEFDPAKSYPLILVIHGGPHNMFGFEFDPRMQLLSAEGYAVLFINPRGSSGYGQRFSHGTLLNWGGGDYKDLMAGLDHVIGAYAWIDPEKLGVTGQSYGGYMANWMITQTGRFKAAVVDGGISNLISFAGTSLYHSLIESEFNGRASLNYPLLWQWSPLRNVNNVISPTLFLHGELDNEVPFTQAEEMYVALKKCGVETSLVQYIGEGHGWRPDLKPGNRQDLYSRMIQWFNQYV